MPTPTESRSPDGFSPNALAELRSEGNNLLNHLIDSFLKEAPKRIATLVTAIANSDHETATLAAHTLKGSAVLFGAVALAALADSAERAARDNDLGAVAAQLPALRKALAHAYRVLKAERQNLTIALDKSQRSNLL